MKKTKRYSCYWRNMRQVHMDYHLPEFPQKAFTRFNPVEFVKQLEHGRINMVALFAKCHFGNSFYDTSSGNKHSGLIGDFLMETANECRKKKIKTLAYYSICRDKYAWDHNPEWRFTEADGTRSDRKDPWGALCMNTPYRDELVVPQLIEIAKNYPVNGFFLDIPYPRGLNICHCRQCRELYSLENEKPMPEIMDEAAADHWRQRILAGWIKDLKNNVHKINPDLLFVINSFGNLSTSPIVSEMCDLGVWESQPHPGNWLTHSLAARTVRTYSFPVQVMTVRFYQGWGDMTLKPEPQLSTEFAVMLGNGAAACVGDQVAIDGTLQKPVYDTFRKSFGMVKDVESIIREASSIKHIAALWPVRNKWHSLRYSSRKDDCAGVRGIHKALLESHVQFDLLRSVDVDKFDDYQILILPGYEGAYGKDVYDKLEKWVKKGGTLIAAGNAPLCDGEFLLKDILGINYIGPTPFSCCSFRPGVNVKGSTSDIPLQFRGKTLKVMPDPAKVLADIHFPETESQLSVKSFRSPYSPARNECSGYPFATINQYGKGKAVYISGNLFRVYWETNHHWLRQFIQGIYDYLVPTPPFRIDAPANVEVNLMRRKNELIFNLMNYQLGHQGGQKAIASIESVYPLQNITCEIKTQKTARVILAPQGIKLNSSYKGGYTRFKVPELKFLSTIRIIDN